MLLVTADQPEDNYCLLNTHKHAQLEYLSSFFKPNNKHTIIGGMYILPEKITWSFNGCRNSEAVAAIQCEQ